ncbi:MAG: hypothetical protein M1832_001117 [Thelocarpon impressellum]|nr:MAG: hypothetical protein M1832_001117 [Thelocarpon impressellum]
MASGADDFPEEPPSIEPYSVLGLQENASPDQIKTAYRKAALKHHPDKAPPNAKDAAHQIFQEIAFAYAILSDSRRRARYDATGRTEESLDLEDDDFDWRSFYREQCADAITGAALDEFRELYQHSNEEQQDVLAAYDARGGSLDAVFEQVMLSNPLDDETRFRKIIDAAIQAGDVPAHPAYTDESKAARAARARHARREAGEAIELAKELGVHDKLFGSTKPKRGKKGAGEADEPALKALIRQRQQSGAAGFLERLEAKYGGSSKSKKGKKRVVEDEPPEEAFQRTAARANSRQKAKGEGGVEPDAQPASGSGGGGRKSKRARKAG